MPMLSVFKQFRDNPAVIDTNGTYSFKTMIHHANILKAALLGYSVLPGDRILVMKNNSFSCILIHLAIADIRAISVPLSPQTPVGRILEIISETSAALCICDEFIAESLKAAGCRCSLLSIDVDKKAMDLRIIDLNEIHRNTDLKYSKSQIITLPDNDIFTILYTSGTTGTPKGVVLTRSNIAFASHIISKSLNICSNDVLYTPVEYNYAAGLLQLFAHLINGSAVCTEFDLIDSHQLLRALIEHSVTTLACVPSTMRLLMRAYGDALFPFLSTLKKIEFSSAPLSSKTVNELHANLPDVSIFNTYGLTEALRVTYFKFPRCPISEIPIGYVNEGIAVSLKGADSGDPASGEMIISGPTIAQGYFNSPEATEASFAADGYISDDRAKIIGGLLYLEGRNNEIINIGAHRVSLVEVEQEISSVRGVHEAVVFAKEHQILDKIMIANVVAAPQVSRKDLIQHLKTRLETYKIPGKINFVDEISKSEAGKIIRNMAQ